MASPESKDCTPFLKALSDKTRWRIVQGLLSAPHTVTELSEELNVSQYNASKHIRILREAGIIETEKKGKHVQCHIAAPFLQHAGRRTNHLDLGCCVFRFDSKCC